MWTFLELILTKLLNGGGKGKKPLTNGLDDPQDRNNKNNPLGGRWAAGSDRESSPTRRWDPIDFSSQFDGGRHRLDRLQGLPYWAPSL
jgi:hypothetical protein